MIDDGNSAGLLLHYRCFLLMLQLSSAKSTILMCCLALPGIALSRKERSTLGGTARPWKKNTVVVLVLCPSFRYASRPKTEIELFKNSFQFGDARKPQRY